jgi:hypothetical protein
MKRLALLGLVFALAAALWAAKKKKEDETQVLQLPKELPAAVAGDTRRLAFHVTPLSSKGLLSQQVREALKALARMTGNAPALAAGVRGSGQAIAEGPRHRQRHLHGAETALPALSLVQSGGPPMEGAQVVLEAIAVSRKDVNPHGLAWISAQAATSPSSRPRPPLTRKSLEALRAAVRAAGHGAGRGAVTCFVSSLESGATAASWSPPITPGGLQHRANAAGSGTRASGVRGGGASGEAAGRRPGSVAAGRPAGRAGSRRKSRWWERRAWC